MNIYTNFKNELGYTDVCNQFVELLLRSFSDEHSDILTDNTALEIYSKKFNINLKDKSGDIEIRLAQNYIININSSFEGFLSSYKNLDGCPFDFSKKASDEHNLSYIISNLYKPKVPDEIKVLKSVCTYYRLLRNHIIHNLNEESSELRNVKGSLFSGTESDLKTDLFGSLKISQTTQDLTFDDQVLFSKAALRLAKHIAYDSTYDLEAHFKKNQLQITQRYKKFNATKRKFNYLIRYFTNNYPITDISKYDEQIKRIQDSI